MATGRIGTTPVLQVRWSKAPSAGTTSLSGLDDNSVSLVYSVGYEAVYRNGVLLSRTNDYTATDGTTVTLIDATITGDIIEIFANQTVPLSDTFSQTVADGRFIKNTLTTTTGDIIYASAANTPARLGIGSSAQVLTVSGGIPAWTTPASGTTFAGCYVYNSTNPSISNNSYTLVNFDTELYDTDAYHSNVTNNSRITVPSGKAGYYLIIGKVGFDNGTNTTGGRAANLTINGSGISYDFSAPASGSAGDVQTAFQTVVRYLAVGDYVQLNCYQNSGGSRTLNQTVDNTYLSVAYLGA